MADSLETLLREAIERLYSVFKSFDKSGTVYGCTHCVDADDMERLNDRRLRDLEQEDLEKYAFAAMTTWGDVNDFRRFLPRILELVYDFGSIGGTDIEVIFGKLSYGDWQSWPKEQRDAVETYFGALWRANLARAEPPLGIGDPELLVAIGRTNVELGPYLAYWVSIDEENTLRRLADFINDLTAPVIKKGRIEISAYLEKGCAAERQVTDWLCSEVLLRTLEARYFAHAASEWASELSVAVTCLDAMRVRLVGKPRSEGA